MGQSLRRGYLSEEDRGSRFSWHPSARVFDGAGGEVLPVAACEGGGIAERPSGLALARALAAEGPFRIGGSGAISAGDVPMFETLTSVSSGAARRIWRTQASWIASFAVNAGLFGIGPGACVAVLGRPWRRGGWRCYMQHPGRCGCW